MSTRNVSTLVHAAFGDEYVTDYWAFTKYSFQFKIIRTEGLRGAHIGGTNTKLMRRYLERFMTLEE